MWCELEDGDEEAVVCEDLWTMARENVKAQYLRTKGKEVDDIFLGLPNHEEESNEDQ